MLFRRPSRSSLLVVAALVATGCSGGDSPILGDEVPPVTSAADPADSTAGSAAATSVPATETTAASNDTATSAPAAPATTVPVLGEPTTTDAAAVAPAPTTTSPPTTVEEPLAVQELVLGAGGIGSSRFGADPDAVISYVSSILGGATADTGWVDPFTFADCSFANESRRVDWGVLSLIFTDGSIYANGRRHFIGWEYGLVGGIGDEPQGLRTEGGVTLGSRVVDLLAEFPGTSILDGDEELAIPASYFLNDEFNGLLTGTSDTDVITVMTGGVGCFG